LETEIKEPLSLTQFSLLMETVPFNEDYIHIFKSLGFDIALEQATNEKIALFCELYEKRVGIKYKVSRADSGKMKEIKVDVPMLNHYFFVSTNFIFVNKYSIAN